MVKRDKKAQEMPPLNRDELAVALMETVWAYLPEAGDREPVIGRISELSWCLIMAQASLIALSLQGTEAGSPERLGGVQGLALNSMRALLKLALEQCAQQDAALESMGHNTDTIDSRRLN